MAFPNTDSTILRGTDEGSAEGRTSTGLSTQIIIKVNNQAVGALQNLTVNQARPLIRVNEIGTDGNVEIVPQSSPTYELSVVRVVFDQMRLPEAFSRSFRFIGSQRIPFDIEIYDLNNADTQNADVARGGGIVVHKYVNCWFYNYSTPYTAENYLISETATIWAETGYVSSPDTTPPPNLRSLEAQTDNTSGIERAANQGDRRGGVDAGGIINAVFES